MSIMMQNICGNEDMLNRLTSSEVIYSELQRTLMKSKGKEDRKKLLKLVVSFVNFVSPVSEKVCVRRINNFRARLLTFGYYI
jgi:Sec7-like guanine-nucleotide exchange factor